MGELGLKAIPTDGLPVPAWSLLIAEYGDCKATFATVGCMRQPHPGRCSVWAPRAQTRVSQSAGRGAHIANKLSEAVQGGAASYRAHFPCALPNFFVEVGSECFLVLAIRVARGECIDKVCVAHPVLVIVSRDASGEEGQIDTELRRDVKANFS